MISPVSSRICDTTKTAQTGPSTIKRIRRLDQQCSQSGQFRLLKHTVRCAIGNDLSARTDRSRFIGAYNRLTEELGATGVRLRDFNSANRRSAMNAVRAALTGPTVRHQRKLRIRCRGSILVVTARTLLRALRSFRFRRCRMTARRAMRLRRSKQQACATGNSTQDGHDLTPKR